MTLPFLDGFSNDLVEMLTIIRQCGSRKTQVFNSEVKVTLRGQRSKIGSIFVSGLKHCHSLIDFDLTIMLTIMKQCVARKTLVCSSKVKVTLRGQM